MIQKEYTETLKTIRERKAFAEYLQQKSQRYRAWRFFVLKDIKALQGRLNSCDN